MARKTQKEKNMEKIRKHEKICLKAFDEIGIKPYPYEFKIWGLHCNHGTCTMPNDPNEKRIITISRLLVEYVEDESFLLGVIGHEMLHAAIPCSIRDRGGHNVLFMQCAELLFQKGIYANLTFNNKTILKIQEGAVGKIYTCKCGNHVLAMDSNYFECPICDNISKLTDCFVYKPSILLSEKGE